MKIKTLTIQTKNFDDQLEFYGQVLGLPVLEKTEAVFKVDIGYTVLEFHKREKSNPYHIAFHIGAKQESDALEWLREKGIEILTDEGKEIVDFPAWNAKSIYFYDEDRNIVELISRKHLNPRAEKFSGKSLLGIAEIGLATNDIEEDFRFLERYFGLETYSGNMDVFCAIGDDEGLLIAVDKNKKTWFPTNDKALPADFDLKFEQNGKLFELRFEEGRLLGM